MTETLEVRDASVTVRGHLLVQGVDLTARGMTALIGPNGAGKSTLLSAIVGLVPLASGTILFKGADLAALGRRDRARMLAFVQQSAATEERLTVRDVVALGRIPFQSIWQSGPNVEDLEIVDGALDEVGMAPLADRQFATLSGGEQQRVLLARALAQQPQLLVLDEPTSNLDIHAQMLVLELLRTRARNGLTVVIALHDLNLAATYCDSVAVLHQGKMVAEGRPDAVLTPALLRDVYDVSATVLDHPVSGRPVIVYEPRNTD